MLMKILITEADAREIVDRSVLEGFRDFQQPGESDLVDTLISLFVEDTTKRLSTLKPALIIGDAAAIKRAAHNVKGAAGNIGAHRLARFCGELEQKASQTGEAEVLISQLEQEFKQVIEVLSSMKNTEQ